MLGAIQHANDWAMAWLENRAAYGRIQGTPVKAEGWMTASFRHLTSRAVDPFPHHHNVIANTVTLPNGTHRALDARHLYRHAQAASALATAEMRHQLSHHLGMRWRPGRKPGTWEIAGIDDRIVREFSQRQTRGPRHEPIKRRAPTCRSGPSVGTGPSFFDHHRTPAGQPEVGIDHAYALTSCAVQGSTRDISTSRDATATRAETYVDITSGRHENHLYLTAAADPSTEKPSSASQRHPLIWPSPSACADPPAR